MLRHFRETTVLVDNPNEAAFQELSSGSIKDLIVDEDVYLELHEVQQLASNTCITKLKLCIYEDFNAKHNTRAKGFTDLVAQNTTLRELRLGASLYDNGAISLASNTTITSLIVGECYIGLEGVRALAANTALTALDVGANEFGDEGALVLAQNTTITSLNVDVNGLKASSVVRLAGNTCLRKLDLDRNEIGIEGARALSLNTTLWWLDVNTCHLEDDCAVLIAGMESLRTLVAPSNYIGDVGAAALARNTSLRRINLSDNKCGAQGALALSCNTTLTSLAIGSNPIGQEAMLALARSANIRSLSLLQCREYEVGLDVLKAISRNTTLTKLGIFGHSKTDVMDLLIKSTTIVALQDAALLLDPNEEDLECLSVPPREVVLALKENAKRRQAPLLWLLRTLAMLKLKALCNNKRTL